VRLTRRDALAGAAAASIAWPVAALADDKADANAAVLTSALEVEQTAVVAYEAIANAGLLGGDAQRTLRSFLDQERQHEAALAKALDDMGRRQPVPPRRADIPGLESLKTARQALAFVMAMERREISTFHRGAGRLHDANALKTLASIMACDGQHLAVLRQLAGRPPVPHAFETGAP
jgi:rubrerythrin